MSTINTTIATRADKARAHASLHKPATRELPANALTAEQVLAMPEADLADFIASRFFGWDRNAGASPVYVTPSASKGVVYETRSFRPCSSADDDRLALRFVRKHHRHLLGLLATAMLDLARTRTKGAPGAGVDPLMVCVYARLGDYCRALALLASTAWWQHRPDEHQGGPS